MGRSSLTLKTSQTVFSSGIVTFGEDGTDGFGPHLGDWKVRLAGLKLFFAICLPLMTLTLCAWLAAYGISRSQRGRMTPTATAPEKLLSQRNDGIV